ncbi:MULTISPECIES: PadR family transcriptional regulator [unclassified Arthrobacter]|uniref:PadR family transcriptional regulator n=1 Tax=unclassified Arthrobacter TaxID=235627 RepID=UPI00159D3706|nr:MULTISPECIES: PadR family transcriptional regulator [unclassified Arthrobacter]MCQ9164567.1 PadR family transcriptional regulator [Arthrobacter sp. STN4]NVM97134.1 PadR family transcriptional regulator [Arthrobacter sp. SDTb3-6]
MTGEKHLTPLGVAALGLLAERPMHPYEMYQLLIHRREDRLVKVKPGTLYHTVGRLAAADLVKAVGTEREGNRPERTTYAILPAGREALEARLKELLGRPAAEYPSFPQAVAEAHNLPAAVVLELLGTRMEALAARLAELAADVQGAQAKGVPEQYWLELLYQQAMTEAELAWIRQLSADIAAGALPWRLAETFNTTASTEP